MKTKVVEREGGEEVEHEKNDAERVKALDLWGEVRRARLSEVAGPQRSDRTVRRSSGEAPLQVVPTLRRDDGVDGTAVSYLVQLALKKEEEEMEREEEREQWQQAEILDEARLTLERGRNFMKRKRKNRRRKKLPMVSSSRAVRPWKSGHCFI